MPFAGFEKAGLTWFKALARAQSREWFQAHKGEFETLWRAPLEALLEELQPALEKVYGRSLGPPKVFRLNRDLRFAKDKSPYKTNLAAAFPLAAKGAMESATALYLSLGLEEMVAFGYYSLEKPALLRLREGILDEARGKALQKVVDRAAGKGLEPTALESLKRVPSGIDPDHPRAALLKLKGLALSTTDIPREVRFSKDLKRWLVDLARAAEPLIAWGDAQKLS